MKNKIPVIVGTLVVLTTCANYNYNYINVGWAATLVIAFTYMSFLVFKKDRLLGVFFFYITQMCLYSTSVRNDGIEEEFKKILILNAYFYLTVTCAATFALLSGALRKNILQAFAILTPLNAIWVILGTIFNFGYHPSNAVSPMGLVDYNSLNGSLIACSIPLLWLLDIGNRRYFLVLLCLIAIVLCKSSMPYGTLMAIVVGCAIRFPYLLLSIIPVFVVGHIREGAVFLNSASRFDAYRVFMKYWWTHFNIWIGAGPGSFVMWGPYTQIQTRFMFNPLEKVHYFWRWIHSEWLTALYELGAIGLVLVLLVFGRSIYFYYKEKDIVRLSSLLGLGATCLFNFPMRYAVFVLLGLALTRTNQKNERNPPVLQVPAV